MTRDEMANIIYDTLFENTQYPQFDPNCATPIYSEYGNDSNYTEMDMPTQEVDARMGVIRFGYNGKEFEITVKEI